ncbi:MAG: hypothetical protein EKK61_03060 [Rickettsiales bacterium]|nr:MAG: hypothetical protein EKK61_03060 [Rickettsiales bacterium]
MAPKKKPKKSKALQKKQKNIIKLDPIIVKEQNIDSVKNIIEGDNFYYISKEFFSDFKNEIEQFFDTNSLLERALIAKDLEALELIDKVYQIEKIDDNFNTIFRFIPHIIEEESKPENKKIIEFLKTIKNIQFNEQFISENDLHEKRSKVKLPDRQKFNMSNKSYLNNYDLYKSLIVDKASLNSISYLNKIYSEANDYDLGILYLFKLFYNNTSISPSNIKKIPEIFIGSIPNDNDREKLIKDIKDLNDPASELLKKSDLFIQTEQVKIYDEILTKIDYKTNQNNVYGKNKDLYFKIEDYNSKYEKIIKTDSQHVDCPRISKLVSLLIRTNDSFDLDNQYIEKCKISVSEEFVYRYHLAQISNEAGLINIAFQHLEKAYQIYKNNDLSDLKHTVVADIVMAYICLLAKFDYLEMVKILNIEKNLLNKFHEIINFNFKISKVKSKINLFLNCDESDNYNLSIIKEASSSQHDEYNIFNLNYNLKLLPIENEVACLLELNNNLKFYLVYNNYDEVFSTINDIIFSEKIATHTKYFTLVLLLSSSSVATENPEKILKFYQSLVQCSPQLYNKNQIVLKYCEFKLYMQCGLIQDAYQLLLNLPNTGIIYELKYIKAAGELYINTLIDNNQLDQAQEYIKEYFIGDVHDKSKLNTLIKLLKEQQIKEENDDANITLVSDEVKNANNEKVEDIVSLIDIAIDDNDINKITDNLDQSTYYQAIHAYHQHRKSLLSKNSFETNYSIKTWKIHDKIIISSNTIKIEGKLNYYAMIDPSLKINALAEKFEETISKGFTSRKHDQAGLKLIKNNIIELKILGVGGDTRLYSHEIYKNSNGDVLIIFNNQANHEKIDKAINQSTLKTIIVKSASIEEIKALTIKQPEEKLLLDDVSNDFNLDKLDSVDLAGDE